MGCNVMGRKVGEEMNGHPDEEAFMILFACTILFHIVEGIDFLYLCDFMGLGLGMPFCETL